MNPYIDYVLSLEETDLTYITPFQTVESLIGATLENKQKSYSKYQKSFIENIKVLDKTTNSTDQRNISLRRKVFNKSKSLLENIAKIESSCMLENQMLTSNEEFTRFLEMNPKKIDSLIKDLENSYSTINNCVSIGHLEKIIDACFKKHGQKDTLDIISKCISKVSS